MGSIGKLSENMNHTNIDTNNNDTNGKSANHKELHTDHYNVNAITNSEYSYEKVKEIADWIMNRVELKPQVGVVCGSGLGGLADRLVNSQVIPYHEIPSFPKSTGFSHLAYFFLIYIFFTFCTFNLSEWT